MEKLMMEKSSELLYDFFRGLKKKEAEQTGLMGGWAVHCMLKDKGISHIGSRDIDVFFDPAKIKPEIIEEKVKSLGFYPHSTFRWVKVFHSDTEKELGIEESKKYPIYELSYIYFDIATPVKTKRTMSEPLLKKVFRKEKESVKIKDIQVMIPSQKVLAEMKLKSVCERTDAFKRTKDIVDLYALLENTPSIWIARKGFRAKTKGLNKKFVQNFKEKLERFKIDGTIANAAILLNTDQNNLAGLLENI